ncbi:MAG: hypothetical protein OXH20_13750 [bacterium]|nr:hypothetical protein [bacterium]MDE0669099.1 hypothetical protein [bacterium]
MAKATKIRLNGDDSQLLAQLSEEFGSPSDAVREGIRMLAEQSKRRQALREFQQEWIAEFGPPDPDDVAESRRRYFNE